MKAMEFIDQFNPSNFFIVTNHGFGWIYAHFDNNIYIPEWFDMETIFDICNDREVIDTFTDSNNITYIEIEGYECGRAMFELRGLLK